MFSTNTTLILLDPILGRRKGKRKKMKGHEKK
jgi:hypothetical protein